MYRSCHSEIGSHQLQRQYTSTMHVPFLSEFPTTRVFQWIGSSYRKFWEVNNVQLVCRSKMTFPSNCWLTLHYSWLHSGSIYDRQLVTPTIPYTRGCVEDENGFTFGGVWTSISCRVNALQSRVEVVCELDERGCASYKTQYHQTHKKQTNECKAALLRSINVKLATLLL